MDLILKPIVDKGTTKYKSIIFAGIRNSPPDLESFLYDGSKTTLSEMIEFDLHTGKLKKNNYPTLVIWEINGEKHYSEASIIA